MKSHRAGCPNEATSILSLRPAGMGFAGQIEETRGAANTNQSAQEGASADTRGRDRRLDKSEGIGRESDPRALRPLVNFCGSAGGNGAAGGGCRNADPRPF